MASAVRESNFILTLPYESEAVIIMECIRKIAELGDKAGFRKSARFEPDEIEMCRKVFKDCYPQLDYVEMEEPKQIINNQ